MRIAILSALPYDSLPFFVISNGLAHAYHRQGNEVFVAGPRGEVDKPHRERTPWGEIIRLGNNPTSWGIPKNVSQLHRLLREVDFLHIHAGTPWTLGESSMWLTYTASGLPFGVTFHYRMEGLQAKMLNRVLKRADWISAVSASLAKELEAEMPIVRDRIRVIPNGFDPQEMESAVSIPKNRPLLERPYILCVARLSECKGIDILLMAWRDIAHLFPSVDLVICGMDTTNGHYQHLAQRLGLSSRVKFMGMVDHDSIWGLLRSCLFFVLSSRHDTWPLPVLEAMASGKAVLATRSGGAEEYLKHSETGLLVPPMDIKALSAGMIRLLDDHSLRNILGRNGAVHARHYYWDRVACDYLKLSDSGNLALSNGNFQE